MRAISLFMKVVSWFVIPKRHETERKGNFNHPMYTISPTIAVQMS